MKFKCSFKNKNVLLGSSEYLVLEIECELYPIFIYDVILDTDEKQLFVTENEE